MDEKLKNATTKSELMKIIGENDLSHRMTSFTSLSVTWRDQVYHYNLTNYKTVKFTKTTKK